MRVWVGQHSEVHGLAHACTVTFTCCLTPANRHALAPQVEAASLDIYGRPPSQLLPNERRAAEFAAGHRRWKGFVDNSIYRCGHRQRGRQRGLCAQGVCGAACSI